ncbi:hypothetical protein JTB14_031800 [Gonioctena quinquepunctata]|nr:hypothetical protein JTB14_031800 [Gonioctena quinquepunctata]
MNTFGTSQDREIPELNQASSHFICSNLFNAPSPDYVRNWVLHSSMNFSERNTMQTRIFPTILITSHLITFAATDTAVLCWLYFTLYPIHIMNVGWGEQMVSHMETETKNWLLWWFGVSYTLIRFSFECFESYYANWEGNETHIL